MCMLHLRRNLGGNANAAVNAGASIYRSDDSAGCVDRYPMCINLIRVL
jgi:hypothetical protein